MLSAGWTVKQLGVELLRAHIALDVFEMAEAVHTTAGAKWSYSALRQACGWRTPRNALLLSLS